MSFLLNPFRFTPSVQPADYIVTNDAEWATVFALSDATLSGKIVEVSGASFTVRSLGGRTFVPALTLRSANAASKLPGLSYTGNITGLHLVGLNIQVTGWPSTNPCINFNLWDLTDYWEIGCTFRHGYGPSGLDFVTDYDYPEYGRPNHTGTATTTSQAIAVTWADPARNSGWIEFWNSGATDIYVKAGTDASVVATAADLLCPAGQRTRVQSGVSPQTAAYLAVLAASGTPAFNFKTEIGLPTYLSNCYSSGGGASITNGRFIGNTYSDLSNGIKFLPDLLGKTVFMDNTARRIYQDVISNGWPKGPNAELHLYRNLFCQPFSRGGIDTDGDARDPHGDICQIFQASQTGRVFSAGNRSLRQPLRSGAGNQGAHYWQGDGGIGYRDSYIINDLLFLQSNNGITMGGTNEYGYIYGCTVLNPAAPVGTTGGLVNVGITNNANSFLGDCIINRIGTGSERLGKSGNHLLNGGAITDRFPNFANLFTATDRAGLEAALTETGAAAGKGAVATRGVIDWTTTDPDQVIKWALLPPGLAFSARLDQPVSSVVATGIRKIMGGPTTMAISVAAGTEYQVTSDLAGTAVVTAWTSAPGTVARGNFLQLRGTTSASYSTQTTLSATLNGFIETVGLTTQEDPALMFTTSSSGPGFADPATTSTGGLTSMTVKARVRPTSLAATSTVWSVHNGPVFIGEIMTSGALRVTVRDGTGTQIAQVSTATGTIVANQWATIVAAVDLPNLTLRVWIDGALKIDVALAANNGVLGASKKLYFLRTGTGTNRFIGNIMRLIAWTNVVTADGSDPASAPYVTIIGPAAVANAHAWKVDAAAT